MSPFFISVLALLCVCRASTPITLGLVQSIATTTPSSTTLHATLPSLTTAGNTIVCSISGGSVVTSVVDSAGNLYALTTGPTMWQAGTTMYDFVALGLATSSNLTVTATVATATAFELFVSEYAGILSVDQAIVGTGTATKAMTSGNRTTLCADELIYTQGHSSAVATIGASYTLREGLLGDFIGDKLVSAVGSYNADGTSSTVKWGQSMITFKVLSVSCAVALMGSVGSMSINGDAFVQPGTSLSLTSALNINGTIVILGSLFLGAAGTVTASSMRIESAFNVSAGGSIVVVDTLSLTSAATFTPVITMMPANNATFVTFLVARSSQIQGAMAFATSPAIATFQGSECYRLGIPSNTITSTSLSTTIAVGNICSSGGLSTGAIVGIALGCTVAVALATLVVIMLVRQASLNARAKPFKKPRQLAKAVPTEQGAEL